MQIEELKKAIAQCRLNEKESADLLEKREEIVERIALLKEELDQIKIKTHSKRESNHKKNFEELERIENELESLQGKLKEMDGILDKYGDEHEENISRLHLELIQKIGEKFPQALTEYSEIQKQLELTKEELNKLSSLQKGLENFQKYLKAGRDAGETKKGLLGFLFGRHPKALRGQAIHQASQEAKKILEKAEYIQESEEIHQKITRFLSHFIEEAENPWNHDLYGEKYTTLFQKFLSIDLELQKEIHRLQENLVFQEKAIEQWIKRFT